MNPFAGRVALVTGGASGIGAALGAALVAAGARVVLADIDHAGASNHAGALTQNSSGSGTASAVSLDVTDRAAFARVVADAVQQHGRLDYLFNNAGIAVIGNTLNMAPSDWDRLLDVNVRGVVHGIEAAYPVMVAQPEQAGFRGHIVNTASLAGLLPVPGFTGYAMTKHAVVGLSVSLREEARRHRVRVSAVCPSVIGTPMADTAKVLGEEGLLIDRVGRPTWLPDADYCASKALAGVRRNKALIPVTASAHIGWRLYRLWPGLLRPVTRRMARELAPVPERH